MSVVFSRARRFRRRRRKWRAPPSSERSESWTLTGVYLRGEVDKRDDGGERRQSSQRRSRGRERQRERCQTHGAVARILSVQLPRSTTRHLPHPHLYRSFSLSAPSRTRVSVCVCFHPTRACIMAAATETTGSSPSAIAPAAPSPSGGAGDHASRFTTEKVDVQEHQCQAIASNSVIGKSTTY